MRSPARSKWWKVCEFGVGRWLRLAIVTAPCPALVRDYAPTEVWEGSIGNYAERFKWVNGRLARRTYVCPIVTEVEVKLSRLKPGEQFVYVCDLSHLAKASSIAIASWANE
jgi:hypothetical protein